MLPLSAFRSLFFGILALLPCSSLHAMEEADFEIFPSEVNLTSQRDRQSLVVRTTDANGVHRDVTRDACFTISNTSKAAVTNALVTPLSDGATTLRVEWNGRSREIPVRVEQSATDPQISFRKDVMPVFMKAECNRCHGAARGQDGFRLSLWGFDPEGDYYRLTRELPGRRINLAVPEESLILTKPDGSAPHTGGKRFEKNSELYNTLLRWLQAGAPNDTTEVARPTRLEVLPGRLVLSDASQSFRLTVRAHYSDGTDRDVTSTALFLTSNESSAAVSPEGVITTGQRGEAFVMARFATFTTGTQVIVVPRALQYEWSGVEERNFVDQLVHAKLRDLRITPSEVCDDATFLRRAYIDLIGLLPDSEEVMRFLADSSPKKRESKIDELLGRKEFVDLWAMKWSELLQIRTGANNEGSYKGTLAYYTWLRSQLEKNVPINEIARQLISATGSTLENPAANYYQLEQDPLKLAEDTAQAFFGIRIQCAQCHNHPFDRWTMEDYRGFVAFFAQVGRKTGEDPRERIIFNRGDGEARHPVGDRVIAPKFLGGDAPETKAKDRRQVLAEWVASPGNPYLARHFANLVWAQYMGRGIVEPVDDVRISNPASNPELLDALATKVIESRFDLRQIVSEICKSRTYQLATRPNETNVLDDRNFAKATIRRMRAEVLLDSISQVTETKDKFQGLPEGARSVKVADGRTTNYFLTTFGRVTRETLCSREEVGPTLSQALHLINGVTVERKITQGGVIPKLIRMHKTPGEIVHELYMRCFGRPPSPEEMLKLEPHLQTKDQQPAVLQDVFWALLNAKEFMFNH